MGKKSDRLLQIYHDSFDYADIDFDVLKRLTMNGRRLPARFYKKLDTRQRLELRETAVKRRQYSFLNWFIGNGRDATVMGTGSYNPFNRLCANNPAVNPEYLCGLEGYPLKLLPKFKNYTDVISLLEKEVLDIRSRNRFAFRICLLFQNAEKYEAFVRRNKNPDWGKPFMSTINQINFPNQTEWDKIDFEAWGSAFLKFGLKPINGLFCLASPHIKPLRDGKSISLKHTWALFLKHKSPANFSEVRSDSLHRMVTEWKVRPEVLKKIFDTVSAQNETPLPLNQTVPSFVIDGREFDYEGAVLRKIDKDDMRLFFLGRYTNCCERIDGVFEACRATSKHVLMTGKSDFYVITDKKTDEIRAHSWVWRANNGSLVFDGFESSPGSGLSPENIMLAVQASIEHLSRPEYRKFALRDVYLGRCSSSLDEVRTKLQTSFTHAAPLIQDWEAGYNISKDPTLAYIGSCHVPTRLLDIYFLRKPRAEKN